MKYLTAIILIVSIIPIIVNNGFGEAALAAGDIEVIISKVNPRENGPLLINFYDKNTWLKPDKALQYRKTCVSGKVEYTSIFHGVPFGEYAVQVVHDEDNNGKLTMGMFGPKEGAGVSGYIPTFIPKFKKARFSHNREKTVVEVVLSY